MIKTFTLHSMTCKEISPGKGSVVWLLSDEKGLPRKVSGIADINTEGIIEHIQAVYSREVPLVEALYARLEGDVFQVNFAPFNQANAYTEREVYLEMCKKEQVQGLSAMVWKAVWVLLVLVLLVFAYTVLLDLVSMRQSLKL